MTKSFRYILQSFAPNYPALLAIGLALTAACALTGAGRPGAVGLARMCVLYFNLFPFILLIALLMAGLALTTTTLNHALAYGGRREDYSRGLIWFTLFNTLIFWGAELLFASIPGLLGWQGDFYPPTLSPMFPALLLAVFSFGCVLGPFSLRHRWASGIVGGMCGGAMAGGNTYAILHGGPVWDSSSWWLFLTCLLVTLVCQLKIRSTILNATVR